MNAEMETVGKGRKRTALLFLGLFALTVLAYGFCLNLPFMCDDFYGIASLAGERYQPPKETFFFNIYDYITPSANREYPQTVPWWTSPDAKLLFLRPLTSLSLKLDYIIGGRNPLGYHLTNILIQGLSCGFLFLIARRLFRRDVVAVVAALVFIGHMYNAFVVPWVAERASLLSMLFALFGLYAHILFRRGKGAAWELAAWLAFILAFLSRESGATCLISYFLYDFFVVRKQRPEGWPGFIRSFLYYTVLSIPLFLFVGYFVLAGYGVSGYYSIVDEGGSSLSTASYIVKNVFFYLEALLFFSLVGNDTNILLFQKWHYWVPFVVMMGLAVVLFYPGWRRRVFHRPLSLFLLSWLFVALLPTLYLLTQNRYEYPATAPFALFISYYLFKIVRQKGFGRWTRPLVYGYIFFLTVVPLAVMNVKHHTFTKVFHFQSDMVKQTQALLQGVQGPVNVFFVNVPSPLYSLAIQSAFDYYMGKGAARVFPLTLGHDVPEVEALGDRSLRVTSHSDPFLAGPGEKLFMSRTIDANREGYTTGNRYVQGTVEAVKDGKIYSIRFDFPEPLDDSKTRFFYMKDRRVIPLPLPENGEAGPLLAPRKSSRD